MFKSLGHHTISAVGSSQDERKIYLDNTIAELMRKGFALIELHRDAQQQSALIYITRLPHALGN